jgi:hypothetical protein
VEGGTEKPFILRAEHIDGQKHYLWDNPALAQPGSGLIVSAGLSSFDDWNGLADGQGGLTLFWDEKDGVHSQRFRADGTRRRSGESVLMSTSTAIQPDAVPDALGGTLVVWREAIEENRSVLMAQHLDVDADPQWPRAVRVSLRASNQMNPRVVYDNMSGMIVAWRDEANSASELRVQRIDFSGNRLWTLEGLKITAPMGLTEYPTIAPLGTGSAVLAWTASENQKNQIFLQRVGPEPQTKWPLDTSVSRLPIQYNRWNPVLLGDDAGGTWVGWEDFRNQINYQIQLNHLAGDGTSFWTGGEIAAAPAQGEQGKMTMMADGKDGVWLAWIDSRLSTVSIYVQNVDPSGQLLQGPKGHLIVDQLNKPSFPKLVSLGLGKAAVVWTDKPKKNQWTLSWEMIQTP